MKIQVEIPADKLDLAVKNLKKELEKAKAKISRLEYELGKANAEVKRTFEMKNKFQDLCNQFADPYFSSPQDEGP